MSVVLINNQAIIIYVNEYQAPAMAVCMHVFLRVAVSAISQVMRMMKALVLLMLVVMTAQLTDARAHRSECKTD